MNLAFATRLLPTDISSPIIAFFVVASSAYTHAWSHFAVRCRTRINNIFSDISVGWIYFFHKLIRDIKYFIVHIVERRSGPGIMMLRYRGNEFIKMTRTARDKRYSSSFLFECYERVCERLLLTSILKCNFKLKCISTNIFYFFPFSGRLLSAWFWVSFCRYN